MAEKSFSPEDTDEGGALPNQKNASQTLNVGKYFLSVAEGGKQYSICLITDCCRRFDGNNIDVLKTHLNVAHNMNLYSTSSTCLDADIESTSMNLLTMVGDDEDPTEWQQEGPINAREEEQNLIDITDVSPIDLENLVDEPPIVDTTAKHKDVRDYFQVFIENNKPYAKCLVTNCQLTLSGNHSGNMFKHLKAAHKMNILPRKLSKMAQKQTRKYFRAISENGKMYSKCLIRGCNFRTVSALLKDFATHLGRVHNMKLFSMSIGRLNIADECLAEKPKEMQRNECDDIPSSSRSTESPFDDADEILVQANGTNASKDVRTFFRVFTENENIYSKCLVDECAVQLSGGSSQSMLKHLRRVHNMMNLQPRGRRRDFIKYPDRTNEADTTNVREFYEAYTENGKIYSKCLVSNCELRLSGNHLGNMMKHLRRAHKMSLLPGRRGKKCKNPAPNLITLDHITPASVNDDAVNRARGENVNAPSQSELGNKFRTLKPSYARKYFRTFMENREIYSECLVQECHERLVGNKSANMMIHIKTAHNEEHLKLRQVQPRKQHQTHGFFREFTENGIEYSECLICKRNLRGTHRGNLFKHLQRSHNIARATHRNDTKRVQTERDPNQTRQYFRTFTLNGRVYSECMAENCKSRLRGKHLGSLLLHLRRFHKKLFADGLQDDENVLVGEDETPNVENALETADSQMAHRKSPKQKARHLTRKYFRTYTDCGRVFSECLVENCNKRLRGNHLGNLAKHLFRRHNYDMNDLYEECPSYEETHAKPEPFHEDPIVDENVLTTPLLDKIIASSVNEEGNENEEFQNVEIVSENAERSRNVSEHLTGFQENSYATTSADSDALQEKQNQVDNNTIEKLKDVRDYFRTAVENGKVYSTCLVNDCELRLSGHHSHNMLKHLQRAHKMMDILPRKEQQTALKTIRKTKLKGRYLTRKYFRTIAENGKIFSECLFEKCKQRMSGHHLGNLSQHLERRHNMTNLYPSPADQSEITDPIPTEQIVESDEDSIKIDAFQDDEDHSSNNSQMADPNVRAISPSAGDDENENDDEDFQDDEIDTETSDARKYFETIKDSGKIFNKCLVENCDRVMSGNHLNNLKKHLTRVHKMVVLPPIPPVGAKTCRLCFKKNNHLLNIFNPNLNIAAIIRLHFGPSEVKCKENFRKFETICKSCLYFSF